jgi:small GTP-binding protein
MASFAHRGPLLRWLASRAASRGASTDATAALHRIRNVGIFAHVDGGKTTTTERILFYSGSVGAIGDVDDGDTVTDFLAQERARGITIQSASVQCEWDNHTINVIDTPGHIDFTVEVERSLRVLDGAVAIIDSVAGVQAQTLAVWRQANRHHVPRIAFVNKIDRIGASFERAVETLSARLGARPVVVNMPIGEAEGFSGGLIDLTTMELIEWSQGDATGATLRRVLLNGADADAPLAQLLARCEALSPGGFSDAAATPDALRARALAAREKMIEALSEFDDEVAETFLMGDAETGEILDGALHVGAPLVWAALRRVVIAQGSVEYGARVDTGDAAPPPLCLPVLCGSALRNRGVQPLLDAIVALFPSPLETAPQVARDVATGEMVSIDDVGADAPLCALAFKTIHHPQRGAITFLRLYAGTIGPKTALLNTTRAEAERPSRLIQIFAGDLQDVDAVHSGQIVGVVGLKHTRTGDTLVAATAGGKGGGKGGKKQKREAAKRKAAGASGAGGGSSGAAAGDVTSEAFRSAGVALRSRGSEPVVLEGVSAPQPVFIAALELEKASDELPLRAALEQLVREDPSLQVTDDEENAQTLLAGMGELHLEIVVERLRADFGLDIELSEMRVAYVACLFRGACASAASPPFLRVTPVSRECRRSHPSLSFVPSFPLLFPLNSSLVPPPHPPSLTPQLQGKCCGRGLRRRRAGGGDVLAADWRQNALCESRPQGVAHAECRRRRRGVFRAGRRGRSRSGLRRRKRRGGGERGQRRGNVADSPHPQERAVRRHSRCPRLRPCVRLPASWGIRRARAGGLRLLGRHDAGGDAGGGDAGRRARACGSGTAPL